MLLMYGKTGRRIPSETSDCSINFVYVTIEVTYHNRTGLTYHVLYGISNLVVQGIPPRETRKPGWRHQRSSSDGDGGSGNSGYYFQSDS